MNHTLSNLPERTRKTRRNGLNMVIDKGLSLTGTQSLIETSAEYVDYAKLGFGTALITNNLDQKLSLYRESGIIPYFGGTLFEAFIQRNAFDEFRRFIDKYKIDTIEVSDGIISIPHDKKCEYITTLAKEYTVLSEVGYKDQTFSHRLSRRQWKDEMLTELQAGSHKVIAEAREGGNMGIYRRNKKAKKGLIHFMANRVGADNIIWEAPQKDQQVWLINTFGANVNLGNIATCEVLALECLRLGLRGDTFFLPFKKK